MRSASDRSRLLPLRSVCSTYAHTTRARCPSGNSDSRSLARNSTCARFGSNTRATPWITGVPARPCLSSVSFIMFAYATDHPINTIIPYPGRVFPIAMGFFHRLSVVARNCSQVAMPASTLNRRLPALAGRSQKRAATASSQPLPNRVRRTRPTRTPPISTTLVKAATMWARTARRARWQ